MRSVLIAVFALTLAAQTPNPATDVSNADIEAFLNGLPRDKVSDLPIRVVDVGGYRVGIFGVFRPKRRREVKARHSKQGEQSHQHVKTVEADERIVGRAEKIRTHCETLIKNQVSPFTCGPEQERAAQQDGREPPTCK